jgi:hypothetical protein
VEKSRRSKKWAGLAILHKGFFLAAVLRWVYDSANKMVKMTRRLMAVLKVCFLIVFGGLAWLP